MPKLARGRPSRGDLPEEARILGLGSFVAKRMTPERLASKASQHAKEIFRYHDQLTDVVGRYEDVLRKRWTKKNQAQRVDILLKAWPGMAKNHRPDWNAFTMETQAQREKHTQYRDHFLLPHINLEDLTKTSNLLLLLNSRGRNHPSLFAAYDLEYSHLGFITLATFPYIIDQYTMFLQGITDQEGYGRVVCWKDDPLAEELALSQIQYFPGEGLVVLEAQHKLLKFLCEVSKIILHDITVDLSLPLVQPTVPLIDANITETQEALAIMIMEAPYRVPSTMDLVSLGSILQARISAAETHVLWLREDPDYFAENMVIHKDHRRECLKSTRGEHHPLFTEGHVVYLQGLVAQGVVYEAYAELEMFTQLLRRFRQTQAILDRHQPLDPCRPLPDEVFFAMRRFIADTRRIEAYLRNTLVKNYYSSPPLRRIYKLRSPIDVRVWSPKLWRNRDITQQEFDLDYLIGEVLCQKGVVSTFRLLNILDVLDHDLQNLSAKSLVSGRVAEIIGDIAIIAQYQNQYQLFQPWCRGLMHDERAVLDTKADKAQRVEEGERHLRIKDSVEDLDLRDLGRLSDLSDRRFHHPVEKRRTKENVEQLCRAEANLAEFWKAIDEKLEKDVFSKSEFAAAVLVAGNPVAKTEPWIDPPRPPGDGSANAHRGEIDEDSIYKPLATIWLGDTESELGLTLSAVIKDREEARMKAEEEEKKKMGNLSASANAASRVAVPDTLTVPEQERIAVDSRSLNVFHTMFHQPRGGLTTSLASREVVWRDFLHAMTCTGKFTAERGYGAIWMFHWVGDAAADSANGDATDEATDDTTSEGVDDVDNVTAPGEGGRDGSCSRILFYEPFPQSRMSFKQARRCGRRLARHYGWSEGTFVASDKKHE